MYPSMPRELVRAGETLLATWIRAGVWFLACVGSNVSSLENWDVARNKAIGETFVISYSGSDEVARVFHDGSI